MSRAGYLPRTLRLVLIVVALAMLSAGTAAAQCSGSRVLPLDPGPTALHFPAPTAADFDAGYIIHVTTIGMTITPPNQGQPWDLCAQAAQPTLGVHGGWAKPLADLELSVSDGPWVPLGVAPVLLLTDRRTQTLAVRVRMRLSWADDVPGTYSAILTFNASM